jgi:hypothetical protein
VQHVQYYLKSLGHDPRKPGPGTFEVKILLIDWLVGWVGEWVDFIWWGMVGWIDGLIGLCMDPHLNQSQPEERDFELNINPHTNTLLPPSPPNTPVSCNINHNHHPTHSHPTNKIHKHTNTNAHT